jgi:carbonic anhydrase
MQSNKIKAALVVAVTFAFAQIASAAGPHWEYEGEHGPGHWGSMSGDYATCGVGKVSRRSISPAPKKPSFPKSSSIKIANNGHTVQVNFAEGSSITVDGKQYKLLQFHFHTPSEEATNGKRHTMVAHFVHKSDDGKLAVIGVLLGTGADNKAFGIAMSRMPTEAGEERSYVNVSVNAAA